MELDEQIARKMDEIETNLFLINRIIEHGDATDEVKKNILDTLTATLKALDYGWYERR